MILENFDARALAAGNIVNEHALATSIFVFCAVSLLLWRLWTFSIFPATHPDDPKELPYWFPLVGHLFPFIADSQKLFAYARNYFGNTREPFAVTAGGRKFYIITRSKDVGEAYRNETTLSYTQFAQTLMRGCGVSDRSLKIMHEPKTVANDSGVQKPRKKDLASVLREIHLQQINPGPRLDDLTTRFYETFIADLTVDKMKISCPKARDGPRGGVTVPLGNWIAEVFIRAGERAYFGQKMVDLDPELKWAFLDFDNLSYQISYQYPRYMAKEAYKNLNRMVDVLETYFQIPQAERTGDAWLIKVMEDEVLQADIPVHDFAIIMMFIYWSLNSNIHQACFWLLAHMLEDPNLIEDIRSETSGAFIEGSDDLNFRYLDEKCPRLGAAMNEMMRVTANSVSARELTEDSVIGGKRLRKGNLVLIPHRQLHYDETVFGDHVTDFDSTRFMKDGRLERNHSWKPFGGGSSMCPGRFLVKRAVMAFIALLLRRFDISKMQDQGFPRQKKTPRLGLTRTREEDELMVNVMPRDPKRG